MRLSRLADADLWRRFGAHWNGYFYRELWFIALRPRRAGLPAPEAMDGYRIFPPPPGAFEADPFLFERGGTTHLFFELFDFARGKGEIAHCALDAEGRRSEPRVVLSAEHHLSYPFVFEHAGRVFMIPESMERGAIALYEAEDFPLRWRPAAALMESVRAVDTTLLELDGRWLLFTNIGRAGNSPDTELHLFFGDSPFGPWTPHAKNPVVCGLASARGAGRIFSDGGRLIRPSQDCSASYGGALNFNAIEALGPADYRERRIARIGPEWIKNGLGVHTFSRTEKWEAVDGLARVRKRPAFLAGQPRTRRGRSASDSSM